MQNTVFVKAASYERIVKSIDKSNISNHQDHSIPRRATWQNRELPACISPVPQVEGTALASVSSWGDQMINLKAIQVNTLIPKQSPVALDF